MANESNLMTTEQVAAFLQVTQNTIRNWRKNLGLPWIKIGGAARYEIEALKVWVQQRGKETKTEITPNWREMNE